MFEDQVARLPSAAEAEAARRAARRLTGLLSAARRDFGELERFLVLLVIATRSLNAVRQLGQPQTGDPPSALVPRVNVRSIADSTGIPRETVRRKVQELLASGVAVRSGHLIGLSQSGWSKIAPGLASMATAPLAAA
jgi:CRP-like cAMP-binding protein